MAVCLLLKHWRLFEATFLSVRTSRTKGTTRRRGNQVGRTSSYRSKSRVAWQVDFGNRTQQCFCVRMCGFLKNGRRFGLFDNFSGIHDQDFVGSARHNPQVVRHQHHSHPAFLLFHAEQIENLMLNCDIESCGGFICKQELWITSKGNGNRDALTHAA